MANYRLRLSKPERDKAVILNLIRKSGPLSRTKLKNITGIRMASISHLTKQLLEEGFVEKCGRQNSLLGRKQALLRLNPDKGFIIGVEFETDHIIALLANLEATILSEKQDKIESPATRDLIIGKVCSVIKEVIQKAKIDSTKILGVGVGDPGLVDTHRGISVFSSTVKDWHDVELEQIIEKRLGYPTLIESATRAKVFAEHRFGAGKGINDLIFIEYGPGIGCGIISEGRLFRGAREIAGELGHTHIGEDGVICGCGSYGCLEAIASQPAIVNRLKKAIEEGGNSLVLKLAGEKSRGITIDHIFQAFQQGDKMCLAIFDDVARHLGIAIANAVNLFNPEMVIFDQRLARAGDFFLERVKSIVMRQALQISTKELKFELSPLGYQAGPLGVIALWLDRIFQIPQPEIPDYLKA